MLEFLFCTALLLIYLIIGLFNSFRQILIAVEIVIILIIPILIYRLNELLKLKRNIGKTPSEAQLLFYKRATSIVEAKYDYIFEKVIVVLRLLKASAIDIDYDSKSLEAHLGSKKKLNVIKVKISILQSGSSMINVNYKCNKGNFERGSTTVNRFFDAFFSDLKQANKLLSENQTSKHKTTWLARLLGRA